jgi:hypothetical protein
LRGGAALLLIWPTLVRSTAAAATRPQKLPQPLDGLVLVRVTGLGALAIYEAAIRPFALSRVLFGLKPEPTAAGLSLARAAS